MKRTFEMRLQQWNDLMLVPHIREFFKTIPEMSQKVMKMHFEEKMPIKEIAAVCKFSQSTARHHQDYGLFVLDRELRKQQKQQGLLNQV